jgi:beta-xylosidase
LETIASYDAVDEGTYCVTVIAMNPANDASRAVCSDGVTIVTTKPSVKNVVLNGAKTDPRLVVDDNGTMWIIWTDITRTIVNSSNICKYVTLEYKKKFLYLVFLIITL